MEKYFIVSNSGLLFKMEFENDDAACDYIRNNYFKYITSCLNDNSIDIFDPKRNYLLSIDSVTGNVIKDWRDKKHE